MQHFNGSYRDISAYDAWQFHMVELDNIADSYEDRPYDGRSIRASFKENGICYTDDDYEYVVNRI